MKSFLIKLSLFVLAICAIHLCWMNFVPAENHIPQVWPMVGFFAAVTLLFHNLSVKASKGSPQGFIRFYMGSTALRLLVYIIVILAYCLYDSSTLLPFALGFMVHYLLFTVFDVYTQLKHFGK